MQPSGKRKIIISFQPEHFIGWGVTIVLCLIPVYLWLRVHPIDTIHGFAPIMLSIGRITGLIGTIMYALNLVYATRWRFLEYWFGGLNRVYIAHHLLGGLALVMLSIHPLFLALRYVTTDIKQAALLLIPNGLFPIQALVDTTHLYHQSVMQQWAILFGIVAFWGMVLLLLITFFVTVPYRLWLFTHKFLGLAFMIGGLHILFVSSDTTTDTALKLYMLTFVIIGIIAFCYKTLAGSIVIRRYKYSISSVNQLPAGVAQIALDPIAKAISYKAGQFVFIRFHQKGISREWHPFTISSNPKDTQLQLSVKALGDYTATLNQLRPGAIADIEGAYGRFSYTNHSNRDQVWVAGGIGITPFLSMIKDLPDDGCRVDLYYSVKTESELIDWPLLYNTAIAKPRTLRVIPFVADKQAKFLDVNYIKEMTGSLETKDFYICGPPPMMQSIRTQLKANGVPGTSIHTEEFAMS